MRRTLGDLLFYSGIVTIPTTVVLMRAAISPTVLHVPTHVVLTLVLIVQGLPLVLLVAAGVVIERRAPHLRPAFRATLMAAVGIFLMLRLGGFAFMSLVDEAIGAFVLRLLALLLYLALVGVLSVAIWRLCRKRERQYAGLVQVIAVVGIFGSVLIAALMAMPSGIGGWYELAPPPASAQSRHSLPPTFVLVFDEISYPALLNDQGELDAERFPNFARLAQSGVVFTDATANYFFTRHALPSLAEDLDFLADGEVRTYVQHRGAEASLTATCGRRFECSGIDRVAAEQPTRILRQKIVATAVDLIPAPFDAFLYRPLGVAASLLGVPTAVTDSTAIHLFHVDHFEQFLEDVREDREDNAVYLFHTLATHFPFMFAADGRISADAFGLGRDGRFAPVRFRVLDHDRDTRLLEAYQSQISYGDRILGRFLDELERTSRLGTSIIIVTADHGIRMHNVVNDEPVEIDHWATHIPLLISAPGVEPGVSDARVQLIDLGATVLDLLDMEAEPRQATVPGLSETPPARMQWFLVDGRWVYHRHDGEWDLVGTLPRETVINRALRPCLEDPACELFE